MLRYALHDSYSGRTITRVRQRFWTTLLMHAGGVEFAAAGVAVVVVYALHAAIVKGLKIEPEKHEGPSGSSGAS